MITSQQFSLTFFYKLRIHFFHRFDSKKAKLQIIANALKPICSLSRLEIKLQAIVKCQQSDYGAWDKQDAASRVLYLFNQDLLMIKRLLQNSKDRLK